MTVPCNGTGDTSITPTLTRRFTPEEWKRAVPGLKRVGKQIQGPCPNCGGKDRFHVNIEPPHLFGCRQCEDGASMMREAGLLQDASWRHRPRMRPRKSGWKKGTPRIPSFGLPRHRSKMSLADYEAAATEEPGSVTDLSWEDIPALALGGSEIERELEKTRELADQELAENLDVDWGITDERYAELMQPVPDPSELMAEIRFFLPHGDVILPLKHLRRLIPEAKRLGIDLAKAMWSIAEERKRAAARR